MRIPAADLWGDVAIAHHWLMLLGDTYTARMDTRRSYYGRALDIRMRIIEHEIERQEQRRYAGQQLVDPASGEVIAKAGQEIDDETMERIKSNNPTGFQGADWINCIVWLDPDGDCHCYNGDCDQCFFYVPDYSGIMPGT